VVTEKQIATNRRNAKRSTGPKTAAGKSIVAQNATKHGLRASALVVVPALDDVAEWEAHQAATVESLHPIGHLEQQLAERIAALLWRLGRVARFESGLIQSAQEAVEDDIHQRRQLFGDGLPGAAHPAELRDRAQAAASTDRALTRLLSQAGSAAVKPEDALALVRLAFDSFAGFTAERVRACLAAVAAAADMLPETCGGDAGGCPARSEGHAGQGRRLGAGSPAAPTGADTATGRSGP
jgi:hypothetical protein